MVSGHYRVSAVGYMDVGKDLISMVELLVCFSRKIVSKLGEKIIKDKLDLIAFRRWDYE
jgi:hypothetical protein